MLATYDYLVVAFYFCFLIGIALYFRRSGSSSSEYFRAGGVLSWWMVGASSFMAIFSAWTFTGAAGLAYSYGLVVLLLYWANAAGFFVSWFYFAEWSRRTRAITALENVRHRFGGGNEQVFTWLQVPFQVLQGGIWLYGLAIFCTPVLGFPVTTTIMICGVITLLLATTGGSWAVVTGDFVQALVLVPVTLVVAVAALLSIGGPAMLVEKLPATHFELTGPATQFGFLWFVAVLLEKVFHGNGLQQSTRYLCVQNGRDAKRAALLSGTLFLVGSFVWFIPPLVARASGLDLPEQPGIRDVSEMSYVYMAAQCLPAGLLGLLVTGIVSATMSSMDAGLNRNAGIFVRSFYLPILRPRAEERELVLAGRASSALFGCLIILAALLYNSWRDIGVFKLMMNFTALLATPYVVPLFWCLIVRRSPDWAGWSSVFVCMAAGGLVSVVPQSAWVAAWEPGMWRDLAQWMHAHDYAAITITNVVVGSIWFLGAARWFPPRWSPAREQAVQTFFERIDTPLAGDESAPLDIQRHLGVAKMCFIYGGFILILAGLADSWGGRGGLAFCGLFKIAVGYFIRRSTLKRRPPTTTPAVSP